MNGEFTPEDRRHTITGPLVIEAPSEEDPALILRGTDGTETAIDAPVGGDPFATPTLDAVLAESTGEDAADAITNANAADVGNPFATLADIPTPPADPTLDSVLADSAGQSIADALTHAVAPTSSNHFATLADVPAPGGVPNLVSEVRSTNTMLGVGDKGKSIAVTAAITQTIDAAATLGSGWWIDLVNSTTDGTTILTVDPNAAETIDGLTTIKMYSGETRRLYCTGTAFRSVMLKGGYAKFTATGNWRVPAGMSVGVTYDIFGKGGLGGAGMSGAAGTARPGGSSGGGGARRQGFIPASEFTPGADVAMTLSASTTTFMAAQAYKGGDGVAADGSAYSGGSGGGAGEFGLPGDLTAQAGGGHASPGSSPQVGQGTCGADAPINGHGLGADWGGGSGAGPASTGGSAAALLKGGTSVAGGGGGGAGGGVTTANNAAAGGDGGNSGFYTDAGGNGGGLGGAATGANGAAGADATGTGNAGKGGGGGGGNASGNGGNGGNGGIPGGGGGGGGSGSTGGGTGGTGGRGEGRIYYA